MLGKTLLHYQILEPLGEGGMGAVYKAQDTRLKRMVALKVIRHGFSDDAGRKARFIQEAQAASALNHPNIVVVYEIGQADGVDYIAMEYVDGKTLDKLIPEGGMPLTAVLKIGLQVADGLAKAHAAGVIHRDLKPSNIMVSADGLVKIVDFGLAKVTETAGADDATLTGKAATEAGAVLGTSAYMSPEQAQGERLDGRSDLFSLGAVLYQMISGHRAFHGKSNISTMLAILKDDPPPLRTTREGVPETVDKLVHRCLAKDRDHRPESAAALKQELAATLEQIDAKSSRSQWTRVAVAALAVILIGAGAWWWQRFSRIRWAREVALPEINRLSNTEQSTAAFLLAREASRYIPGEGALKHWYQAWTRRTTFRTDPPGASVYLKDYMKPETEWTFWGVTPLENVLVPAGHIRFRLTKDGYEAVERGQIPGQQYPMPPALIKSGQSPQRMVLIPGSQFQFRNVPTLRLGDYWIDRFEVANKEYQQFVDQGGYQKRDYWRVPFSSGGRTLTWEQAMAGFRDSTGQPGPSTWELGRYPRGQGDFPVRGVSWFEATAYAAFAGKSLPTVYHWNRAAGALGIAFDSDVIRLSNYEASSPAPAGKFAGMSPFGVLDMAGNAAEWVWNARGETRYLCGGAWTDAPYVFIHNFDAQTPFERRPTSGFRCVKYLAEPSPESLAPVDLWFRRDYSKEKPADEATFAVYRGFYRYDKLDLKAKVETVDESPEFWRKESVSYTAAYGDERIPAHLFLPKNGKPPYQAVIYFPGQNALQSADLEPTLARFYDFIVRSGRALVFPIYKGTYQRRISASFEVPSVRRDLMVYWTKDIGRTIDYLETRSDIDATRIAYTGLSRGATDAPIYGAIETRLKTLVLFAGGFPGGKPLPEADPIHFAPRVKVPTLMVNGRNDFNYPLEHSQKPLFRWLGAPEKHKRHFLLDSGHSLTPLQPVIKETLEWLDKYLGPVQP